MAISNLVSPGQASERPSVSAFFGQSYTGGATQKVSSTMMSDSFVDSTMNMLKGLNTEIARIQTTAKKTLSGFDKVINSIRDLNRNITMRFRTLNNELTASRVDFLRGVLNAPETPPPSDLGGTPVLIMKDDKPVDKPNTPAPDTGGGVMDTLMALLGGAQAFTALKDIIKFLSPAVMTGITSALTFLGPVLVPAALALGFLGMMRATIGEENRKLLDMLGVKEGMSQDEIGRRKREYFKGREQAPQKEGAQRTILSQEIMDGKHDKAIGITPNMEKGSADRIRSKIAEDVTFGKIPDSLQDKMPALPGKTLSGGEEPGYGGSAGKVLQDSLDSLKPQTQGPPAPPQTKAQKSQANRDKARQQQQGTPAPAAPPADTGGQSEGAPTKKPDASGGPSPEQLKAALKETGDSKIINTNKFKPGRAGAMSDDDISKFEGFKTSEQKSMSNQMIPDARNPGSNIDRGSADEFEIMSKLERGERVDPDKPPPTMTKRELASRIEQFGMPALAAGAYTPEEFKKITKQAGQYQWQSNAQEKAGEWIKNQSAEAMAKKSFKPLVPPVVMNNSSTSNSSSSEGGEGNNVAGQNFPLSAINPQIQPFLQKQNVQYQ
jgi:hypothetical protein